MDNVSSQIKNALAPNVHNEIGEMNYVPFDRYFAIKKKKFRFHTIDIKTCDKTDLERITRACEEVERECWSAQEDFFEFVRKRDILTYVEKDGRVIAFQVVSYSVMDEYFLFDLDETMVLKEFRGKGLASLLSFFSGRRLFLTLLTLEGVKNMVFMAITPNPRLINYLDRYRHLFKFMDNTFKPSSKLIKVHDKYLEKKNIALVDKNFPFFIKEMYPGSQRKNYKEVKFSRRISRLLPPGLDFAVRGDAFLFFASFSKLTAWPMVFIMMIYMFGVRSIFNRKVGYFSRKKTKKIASFEFSEKKEEVIFE